VEAAAAAAAKALREGSFGAVALEARDRRSTSTTTFPTVPWRGRDSPSKKPPFKGRFSAWQRELENSRQSGVGHSSVRIPLDPTSLKLSSANHRRRKIPDH
jgi:hypothetical protein